MAKLPRADMFGPYLLSMEIRHDWISSYDAYPFCLPAVKNVRSLNFHPKVTFLIGENGSGKSTLLEAIAVAYGLNPEGGSRNIQFATFETHSNLGRFLRLSKQAISPADAYFLRAETFYNVASELERIDSGRPDLKKLTDQYGGKSLHAQSHGESFYSLFCNRFGPRGLYLLDEPEAALSPQRQLGFLALLHEYCNGGSQFIIATHSPILMAYPDAAIHVIGENGLTATRYEETEHYKVTKNFLLNPARSLKVLLADDEPTEPS
jgi:predicted ATPase